MKHEAIEAVIPLPPILALAIGTPAAPRSTVEAMIERMIEALDTLDGDPDIEPNGDELEDSEALQSGIDERGRWCEGEPFRLALGDCEDDEDGDQDYCLAGDDGVFGGSAMPIQYLGAPAPDLSRWDEDCEQDSASAPRYGVDQTVMIGAPPAKPGAYDWNLNGWTQ